MRLLSWQNCLPHADDIYYMARSDGSMFVNLQPQASVFVIFGQLAEVGIGSGVGSQALFAFGIAGVDFGSDTVW